jgi:tetratricopeptide (TPR) repeat protein
VAVVFLALVGVQLWWGSSQEEGDRDGGDVHGSTHIRYDDGTGTARDIEVDRVLRADDFRELMQARIALLTKGKTDERRLVALELAREVNRPGWRERWSEMEGTVMRQIKDALFEGLNDPDRMVSDACRDAILGLWRISASAVTMEHFERALIDLEEGRAEDALKRLESMENMRNLPVDYYRLKAEVHIDSGQPDKALEECSRALRYERRHFLALYLMARAHTLKEQPQEALQALDRALGIYTSFPEAAKLRGDLISETVAADP